MLRKSLMVLLVALLAGVSVAGCKSTPGADGRYAEPGRRGYP